MARTIFWATVEPTFGRQYSHVTGEQEDVVRSVKVTGITQSRPKSNRRIGTITCKLTLEIPDSAFLPLRPEAIIVVPEDMVMANLPIEVVASDANESED